MTAAPVGAPVRFYFDCREAVAKGDAIRTPTGRTYVVLKVREQLRGKHVGRKHLLAIVAREPPEGARVFTLTWYPRKRRAGGAR